MRVCSQLPGRDCHRSTSTICCFAPWLVLRTWLLSFRHQRFRFTASLHSSTNFTQTKEQGSRLIRGVRIAVIVPVRASLDSICSSSAVAQ